MRLLLAALAAALPPHAVFVPGSSLAGVHLGARAAAVEAALGRRHGVCKGCARTTWYFTYKPYTQPGLAVEFADGRVDAVYTIWQPAGWHTRDGLHLGDREERVATVYGALPRKDCGTYAAYLETRTSSVSAFYVLNSRVWGFGLLRPSAQVCR